VIDQHGNIVHEARFAHPIERVWTAISDPAELAQWLMPNNFEPRVGRRFQLDTGPARGVFDAEAVAIEPPHRMQWLWYFDGAPSTVTITLAAEGDSTLLRLEHADLPVETQSQFDTGWVEKFDAITLLLEEKP
jgi:uncharacterized protein YndB with AHSA1/START domain